MDCEYTRGPWKVDDRKTISYACMDQLSKDHWPFAINAPVGMALGSIVAAVPYDYLAGNHSANARLIAAAPELLEALKLAKAEIQKSGNWVARDYGWPDVRKAIDAAISKAEGK